MSCELRENSGQVDVGGRPGFPGARQWVASSATGVGGFLNSGFLCFLILNLRTVSVRSWFLHAGSGSGLLTRPASATARIVARKEFKVYFFLPHARPVTVQSWS